MIKTQSPNRAREAKPRKYKNQPCEDSAGNKYPSLAERAIVEKLRDFAVRGYCTNPTRGVYRFELNSIEIGKYTSDADFECLRDFTLITRGGIYEFKAGQKYVCDVKSPITETTSSKLRVKMMRAFFGITVCIIATFPKPAKTK